MIGSSKKLKEELKSAKDDDEPEACLKRFPSNNDALLMQLYLWGDS